MKADEPSSSPAKNDQTQEVICCDAIEGLDTQLCGDHRYDVIIADPPYNVGKTFGSYADTLELEEYIEWTRQWLGRCMQLLEDDGLVYVYGFAEILAHVAVEFPVGKQRWLVWHYTNKTAPRSRFWQRSHENILCLWKGRRPNLVIDQIREPYTEAFLKCGGKVRTSTQSRFSSGDRNTIYAVHRRGALPRDVLKVPALAGGAGASERWFKCETCDSIHSPGELRDHRTHETWKHPTQKPIELSRRLLESVIDRTGGGRVLIPFVGSGSECVVAKFLNFSFLGFEINPEYADFACQWLDLVESGSTDLFHARQRISHLSWQNS